MPFLLILLKSVRQGRPDVFLHENVKEFPIELFQQTLGGLYDISCCLINPGDHCGLPVQRVRRYALMTLKARITQVYPLEKVVEMMQVPTADVTLDAFLIHQPSEQVTAKDLCKGSSNSVLSIVDVTFGTILVPIIFL